MSRLKAIILSPAVFFVATWLLASDEAVQAPADALAGFVNDWNDKSWLPPGNGRFTGYLRPQDDTGWRTRMRSFRSLVAGGRDSVEPLLKSLHEGQPPERILAAQTLGFVGAQASRDALLEAARSDAEPAVRLHAIDSLGMLGGVDLAQELRALDAAEKDHDVKRHIAYAVERKDKGLEPQIVQDLAKWDPVLTDSAKVGQAAPDFDLPALTGEKIRLSDFRGKKAVVLVFIYGDT